MRVFCTVWHWLFSISNELGKSARLRRCYRRLVFVDYTPRREDRESILYVSLYPCGIEAIIFIVPVGSLLG